MKIKLPKIHLQYKDAEDFPRNLPFINIANFKYILNSVLYIFSDNALWSQVYIKKLSENYF